jgi:hypothetical protein
MPSSCFAAQRASPMHADQVPSGNTDVEMTEANAPQMTDDSDVEDYDIDPAGERFSRVLHVFSLLLTFIVPVQPQQHGSSRVRSRESLRKARLPMARPRQAIRRRLRSLRLCAPVPSASPCRRQRAAALQTLWYNHSLCRTCDARAADIDCSCNALFLFLPVPWI